MKSIRRTTQFKKDVRRMRKRGRDLEQPKRVIQDLAADNPQPTGAAFVPGRPR